MPQTPNLPERELRPGAFATIARDDAPRAADLIARALSDHKLLRLAAHRLGLSRRTLARWMARLEISSRGEKAPARRPKTEQPPGPPGKPRKPAKVPPRPDVAQPSAPVPAPAAPEPAPAAPEPAPAAPVPAPAPRRPRPFGRRGKIYVPPDGDASWPWRCAPLLERLRQGPATLGDLEPWRKDERISHSLLVNMIAWCENRRLLAYHGGAWHGPART